jgi:anti-sigma B factor antagonist
MLSINIQKLEDVSIFHCSGRITAGHEDLLRAAVRRQSRARTIVLDFAEIDAVDAAGLGILVSLRAWTKENGAELKLMNLTSRVDQVLRLTNLRSSFEVCSVREMMDLMCRARRSSQFDATAAMAQA